ncbi:hypothetical protein BDM02DRAFT_3127678 [Thelephora ganbajun]|uniref:Uncharacterized protein n=1 Tax=Thelephora ganbajun TaxID=370292 RepID=A0ACB6ZM98_THEGA|nr:hypothetical protein BDM02DRAFT_3127678 [Thelephora ganbajun]
MRIQPFRGETLLAIFKFRNPAPLLEHLEIYGYPLDHISRLPRDFLGCHVPSLRFLIWGGSLLPAPSELYNLTHPSLYDADEASTSLHVVLRVLSSAPLLEYLSISILDAGVVQGPTPVHDIRLDFLRHLHLASGAALSQAIPHFKAPQLKELSLTLPSYVGVPTIADLLPSDSYPLIMETTSMEFYIGPGDSAIELKGKGIKVRVNTLFPDFEATFNFFSNMTIFPIAQITRLMLRRIVRPLIARMGEFTNLEMLDLMYCQEDAEVLSALSPSPQSVSPVPCPRLIVVVVAFYYPTTHVVDSFKQMVRLRKEAENPLVNVNFRYFDGIHEMLDIEELNGWLGQAPPLE